jgi:foldase protein PrsA
MKLPMLVLTLVALTAPVLAQTQTAPAQTAPAEAPPAEAPPAGEEHPEPQRVKVQHILIGFQGSVRGKAITRTLDEARTLAYEILARAQAGEDFDALVKAYTDDSYPGTYSLANHEVAPLPGEYRRGGMVKAFGDVAFGLEIDEVGIADYDPATSRYGWHIIKRLE